jgi:hypothetical protein
MEPDEVILEFERMALDEQVELDVDDAIAALAALLTDDMIQGEERALLERVGATLYRIGLNERVVAAVRRH